ncbi:MAG: 23S rRNA methyltransferase [Cellvibrionales bacterium TMED49]|nr:23S rRNA methyltransferase [Porticoccaceae bacterium]OUU40808.1 MAG: 23S rRNA methyltransferase [Cellvibrionales bacterium TMED49]|tara:strand:- start:560 stop:1189 length:630 start_codon:yes stop_codon:yes gene_type:complete
MAKLKKRLWIQNHVKDPHVKKSISEGFRSRASYKLLQMNEKDQLLKPGMAVIDLGGAPGGWAQVASKIVGKKGAVVSVDLLPIEPIMGVHVLKGDIAETSVFSRLQDSMGTKNADLVMSDMAPNLTGINDIDGPKIIHLANLAVVVCEKVLTIGGSLVVKLFHSDDAHGFVRRLRRVFNTLKVRKPTSSRSSSSEFYVVAKGYKGGMRC